MVHTTGVYRLNLFLVVKYILISFSGTELWSDVPISQDLAGFLSKSDSLVVVHVWTFGYL